MLTSISTNKTHALKLQRVLSAPVERVYKAWTDPKLIPLWFGCDEACKVEVEQDFHVGGAYTVKMHLSENNEVMTVQGVFKEIVHNEKLVYTWNSESVEYPAEDTLVSVQFKSRGDKTEVVLDHTNFALQKSAEGHAVGWTAAFDKLQPLTEKAS